MHTLGNKGRRSRGDLRIEKGVIGPPKGGLTTEDTVQISFLKNHPKGDPI